MRLRKLQRAVRTGPLARVTASTCIVDRLVPIEEGLHGIRQMACLIADCLEPAGLICSGPRGPGLALAEGWVASEILRNKIRYHVSTVRGQALLPLSVPAIVVITLSCRCLNRGLVSMQPGLSSAIGLQVSQSDRGYMIGIMAGMHSGRRDMRLGRSVSRMAGGSINSHGRQGVSL